MLSISYITLAVALSIVSAMLILLSVAHLRFRRKQRFIVLAWAEREQRALQERDFFEQIINGIPEPIFVQDRQHHWVLANQAFCDLLRRSRESLIGKTNYDVFAQEEARVFCDNDERVFNAGIANIIEEKLTDNKGHIHTIVTKKMPITTAQGNQYLVGINSDISARKQVERLLRAKEREFRSLTENLPDNIARFDRECRYLYHNRRLEVSLGMTGTQRLGKTPSELRPDGSADAFEAMLRRVIERGEEGEINITMPDLGEGERYHHVLMTPERDEQDEVCSVLAIGRDITERRRLEEALLVRETQFRSLAENSPDPIYRYDRDCRRLYVNPAVARITGKPAAELIGQSPADSAVLVAAQGTSLMQGIRRVFEHGQAVHVDLDFVAIGGSFSHYDMLLVPERDRSGQVVTVLAIARDITAIREAERRMSHFLSNVPGFVFSFRMSASGHGSFPFTSPGIRDIYGLLPEDVRDDMAPLHSLTHPDDRPLIERALADTGSALSPFQIEVRVVRSGWPERWVECRSTPERETDGSILWHGIMLDITERKAVERALHESEAMLQQAQRIAHVGSWDVDMVNDKLTWSDETFRIWEIDKALFAASFAAFLETVHPEDRDLVSKAYNQAVVEHSLYEVEHRLLFPDGRIKYIQERGEPHYDEAGNPVRFIGTSLDITERKQTENWYRSILQSAPDGMLVIDRDGVIIQVNTRLEIMFGYASQELIGQRVEILLPEAIREIHAGLRSDFVASGSLDRPMAAARQLRARRKDGSEFPVDISLSQLSELAGRRGVVCAAIRDITERRRVEEALLARGQELKQSRDVLRLLMTQQEKEREQERKRIAWEVHEELGQNLMALRMNLSMLHARLEQDSAPMQEQFRSTKDLLDRSIRVARTVTTSLRPKVLDLGIVSALEWLVEEFVKQTDIACELRHEVAEAALNEDFVVAIFRFAEEALDNVARHADARWVEVSLERCEGNYLLCVRDDGKGFDTDPREHRSIGLLSMQERARALGGETTITSTQGKGTEIAVRIPA